MMLLVGHLLAVQFSSISQISIVLKCEIMAQRSSLEGLSSHSWLQFHWNAFISSLESPLPLC